MALNFSKLGETKVTVPLILILAVAVAGFKAQSFTVDVLDEFFFTDVAAADLAKQVQDNNKLLVGYIEKQEVKEINRDLIQIDEQITETQLWMSANGENPIATARLTDLVKRKGKLVEKKDCLLNDNIIDKGKCDVE